MVHWCANVQPYKYFDDTDDAVLMAENTFEVCVCYWNISLSFLLIWYFQTFTALFNLFAERYDVLRQFV